MNRTGQIFSPFVLLLLSLSCICIFFFYGDKTRIVAHAVSGFYMHGAAVMFGYSELLLLKSIRFFNQAQLLFLCSWSRFWSIVRLSRYSIINDVLSSSQPLILDEILVNLCIMKHADIAVTLL